MKEENEWALAEDHIGLPDSEGIELLDDVLEFVDDASTPPVSSFDCGGTMKTHADFIGNVKGGPIIGVDFGTTKCVVAVMEGRDTKIIPNHKKSRYTSSEITIHGNNFFVSESFQNRSPNDSSTVIGSIKRFLDCRVSQDSQNSSDGIYSYGYDVVEGPGGFVNLRIGGRNYMPSELVWMFFKKIKEFSESHLGRKVSKAVLAIPVSFTLSQLNLIKDAARQAGLEIVRTVHDSTTAAIAYGLGKSVNQKIIVVDFGGGFLSVSCLEIADGVFRVIAVGGDNHLGGDDIDTLIVDWVIERLKSEQGIDLRENAATVRRFRKVCENAKVRVSTSDSAEIRLPYAANTADGWKHLRIKLTRAKLEQLISPLIERCLGIINQTLNDASLSPSQIDEIILVGGATQIPAIKRMIIDVFGKSPYGKNEIQEMVAIGAAIQGGVLAGEVRYVLLMDATPFSFGIETLGGIMVRFVDKNTTIPVEKKEVISTANDNQSTITIKVYQGENDIATDNLLIARFNLEGILPAPRGMPQIEVTFDLDANGILNVSAKDLGTQKELKVQTDGTIGVVSAKSEEEEYLPSCFDESDFALDGLDELK